MKHCPKCGRSCRDNDIFCFHCGYKFNEQQQNVGATDRTGNYYNPIAVASLVIGIVSMITFCFGKFGFMMSVLAAALGFIARNSLKNPDSGEKGRGFAYAGITLGILSLVLVIIVHLLSFICTFSIFRPYFFWWPFHRSFF